MELSKVLSGSYEEWQGLAPDLSMADLEMNLQPVKAVRGPEEQQRTYQRFHVTHYSRPVPPHKVDAWCAVGQEMVNILECAEPLMPDLEGTLKQYAPPDLLLPDLRYAAGMRVWDYVYPSRGITFSIGEPFPPAPPSPRRAIFLQLFPAASIQFYLTDVGSGIAVRPDVWPETAPTSFNPCTAGKR